MSKKCLKFFPFSIGIPWELKNGRYIVPKLSNNILYSALKDKDIVVSAFGGFLESFFSMTILEKMNYMMPSANLFWCGNKEYYDLIDTNGLAKSFDSITVEDLGRFPTPIFLDKENRAYFNCLNNYLKVYTYYLTLGYNDDRSAIQQITEKSTLNWDNRFLPKIRNTQIPADLNFYLKMYGLKINSPFVIIIPEKTSFSIHDNICLNWDSQQIRSFAAILSQYDISLIVMTEQEGSQSYGGAHVLPLRVDFLMHLLSSAKGILSRDVDFLLVANAASDAAIVSEPQKGAFNLEKNAKFLAKENVIYTKEEFSPIDAWNYVI